jgi:hypothetical protein
VSTPTASLGILETTNGARHFLIGDADGWVAREKSARKRALLADLRANSLRMFESFLTRP